MGNPALSTGLKDVIGDGRTVLHAEPLPLPGDLRHRESTDHAKENGLGVAILAPEQRRDIATWERWREGSYATPPQGPHMLMCSVHELGYQERKWMSLATVEIVYLRWMERSRLILYTLTFSQGIDLVKL